MADARSQREDIAAGWLIDQNDAGFTDGQREELVAWLIQSPDNCRAYVTLVRTWQWTSIMRRSTRSLRAIATRDPIADDSAPLPVDKPLRRTDLFNRRYGELVATERVKRGFSQADLAARAGMEEKEICGIESGIYSPTVASACLLSAALGLPPTWIMTHLEMLLRGKIPAIARK
jgi:ribosome-binding protein aMBF1 (putative translation factor)